MTTFRLIPFPLHGALDMVTGLSAMIAPFVLGFGPAGTIVGILVGSMLVGLALYGVLDDAGRPALPVAAHHAADYGIAIGLFGVAALLGFAGDLAAAAGLGTIAAAQLAINLTTRYSLRA